MEHQAVEAWLKATAIYGLAFVALSIFVGICLYGFWHFVRNVIDVIKTAREYLPPWFQAQLESHRAVVKSADTLTESLGGVREKTESIHQGITHLVHGVEAAAKKHCDHDVLNHLEHAKYALGDRR